MKALFLSLLLFSSAKLIFSQCPSNGSKVESDICNEPTDVKASVVNCSQLELRWKGYKNQTFVVEVRYTDPVTSELVEITAGSMKSQNDRDFTILIPVKEGSIVDYLIQTACSFDGATIYSYKAKKEGIYVPRCDKKTNEVDFESLQEMIQIFPNPSMGLFNTRFSNKVYENLEFNLFELSGKLVLKKIKNHSVGNNVFSFDLKNYSSGTYFLEIKNGTTKSRHKVVLIK